MNITDVGHLTSDDDDSGEDKMEKGAARDIIARACESVPAEIQALADARTAAKANRDWATADSLRAQIDAAGWTVLDTKDGAKIVKKA